MGKRSAGFYCVLHRVSITIFAAALALSTHPETAPASVRHYVFDLERRVDHDVRVGGALVLEGVSVGPASDLTFSGSAASPVRITPAADIPAGGVDADSLADSWSIGPTPVSGPIRFRIRSARACRARVDLFDGAVGRRVLAREIELTRGENSFEVDPPGDLPSGLYFVRVIAERGVLTRKVLVLRGGGGAPGR